MMQIMRTLITIKTSKNNNKIIKLILIAIYNNHKLGSRVKIYHLYLKLKKINQILKIHKTNTKLKVQKPYKKIKV